MTRVFDINRALGINTAQTTGGHRVTGLQERCDPVSKQRYLLGWSWQPSPKGYGCVGPQRWTIDGVAIDSELGTDLTNFECVQS